MKKNDIVNLIKCYADHNDSGFRAQAATIASYFNSNGDPELAEYIMSLISTTDMFAPQMINYVSSKELRYCVKTAIDSPSLLLPQEINDDIMGIVNAIGYNAGVNKFIFSGAPGTGKTETVKQIARILNRELYSVDFDMLIDSKLGQTAKNISEMFSEINRIYNPEKLVILLDEIDSLAMSRVESNDIREMGRATSALMKGLDSLNSKTALIATTNLIKKFDKALIRRFDSVVDFNRYSQDDLAELAEGIVDQYINIFTSAKKDVRLFRKVLKEYTSLPFPGELANLIRTSLAFSDRTKPFDYIKRMYKTITKTEPTIAELKKKGYSIREIEKLTGISKSSVAREANQITVV